MSTRRALGLMALGLAMIALAAWESAGADALVPAAPLQPIAVPHPPGDCPVYFVPVQVPAPVPATVNAACAAFLAAASKTPANSRWFYSRWELALEKCGPKAAGQ